jgi:hypothetical protein
MACKGVKPITLSGNPTLGFVYMYMRNHSCLEKCVLDLEIRDIALGFMYPYLVVSINIGFCAIFLGICVLHWDMCHHIGICENASGDDRDVTSSHFTHGPLQDGSLSQLDAFTHIHA